MEKQTDSKQEKEHVTAYIVTLLIYLICRVHHEKCWANAGLEEAQTGMKTAERNINNLKYADDTTLWQKVKEN